MCGIAGEFCYGSSARVDERTLRAMGDAMRHRGPDDDGYFLSADRAVGFAHRRLSIIDLSTGHQPIYNEDRSVCIVFNGEIYNFPSLRKQLERQGHQFATNTDTEAIVHLYEEHGTGCLDRLRGMFAFALWDSRKQRLFVARDRFGKKPLFYADAGGRLTFASELNALMASQHVVRDLDPQALDMFLSLCYIPAPWSIFRAARKLPPAHYMIVDANGVEIRRYWRLEARTKMNISFEDAKAELRRRLAEAVRIRLVSDVPLGAFLSGGVDSSIVTALMCETSTGPVKTFSIGFPNSRYDERPYADVVAKQLGTEHHQFVVEPASLDVLPQIVQRYGEPFGDSSALNVWFLSQMTREYVTVALTGDGSDEMFAGYERYAAARRYNRLAARLPAAAIHGLSSLADIVPHSRWTRKARRLVELMDMSDARRFAELNSFLNKAQKRRLYSPELRDNVNGAWIDFFSQPYEACQGDDLDRMLITLAETQLPNDYLVKVDIGTMAHSLEARCPFLDHELAEFVAAMPSDFKLNAQRGKHILKESMASRFPPGFFDRRKMGFQAPTEVWFRDELKTYTHDRILHGALQETGLLDMSAVQCFLNEHAAGHVNHETRIWNLLVLDLWCERYLSP